MVMYNKNDSIMTKGLAILSMLVLHLFCVTGEGVLGTPLLWVNETTPAVYYLGFFAEICVPLYSMCAGFAQYLLFQKGKTSFKSNGGRILRLLTNYWIVLFLFGLLGLIFKNERIPASPVAFIKSIFLLHSYNGAWWYLNTYILLLLIPAALVLLPVKKIKNSFIGFSLCFGIDIAWYFLNRFNFIPELVKNDSVFTFVAVETLNIIDVLPWFWMGAFFCKFKTMDTVKEKLDKFIPSKYQNLFLLSTWILIFIANSIVHKAVLMGFVSVASFLIFNLLKKSNLVQKVFLFLGKHSTNMWLTHMFFYAIMFKELLVSVKYPLFILLFLILLCVITSYCVMGIQNIISKVSKSLKGDVNAQS